MLTCLNGNGCNYNNEIVVATAVNSIRVSLLSCISSQFTSVTVVTYIPPYPNTDIGCSYSGTLLVGQILEIGAMMLAVQGVM
jgi:hypothetical protein